MALSLLILSHDVFNFHKCTLYSEFCDPEMRNMSHVSLWNRNWDLTCIRYNARCWTGASVGRQTFFRAPPTSELTEPPFRLYRCFSHRLSKIIPHADPQAQSVPYYLLTFHSDYIREEIPSQIKFKLATDARDHDRSGWLNPRPKIPK